MPAGLQYNHLAHVDKAALFHVSHPSIETCKQNQVQCRHAEHQINQGAMLLCIKSCRCWPGSSGRACVGLSCQGLQSTPMDWMDCRCWAGPVRLAVLGGRPKAGLCCCLGSCSAAVGCSWSGSLSCMTGCVALEVQAQPSAQASAAVSEPRLRLKDTEMSRGCDVLPGQANITKSQGLMSSRCCPARHRSVLK